jgi:DNA-directed RNA polymerase specialized sigma24 family protein
VIILFELEELSGEEIAALTGLKLATVWVHLHRGRERFLTELRRVSRRST